MKIRTSFVGNSSSCSFTVDKSKLTGEQYKYLMYPEKYFEEAMKHICEDEEYYVGICEVIVADTPCNVHNKIKLEKKLWNITEKRNLIRFDTMMDNFDYLEYAERLGVSIK